MGKCLFPVFSGNGFSVTLFKKSVSESQQNLTGLNDRRQKAVEYARKHEFINNSIYQELFSTSERYALRDLENIVSLEIFMQSGTKKALNIFFPLADNWLI